MMIDLRRIEDKFRTLDECCGYLQSLAKLQKDQITQDPINLGAAKYYLQIAIESCIDVANHLIAQSSWDRPETFAEAFSILAKNGVIEPEFSFDLQKMARFRNRLVHIYWEVEAEEIFRILQDKLDDFTHFQFAVLKYLK